MYMTSVAAKRPGVSAAEIPAVGTPLITSDPDLELPLGARDDHISQPPPRSRRNRRLSARPEEQRPLNVPWLEGRLRRDRHLHPATREKDGKLKLKMDNLTGKIVLQSEYGATLELAPLHIAVGNTHVPKVDVVVLRTTDKGVIHAETTDTN